MERYCRLCGCELTKDKKRRSHALTNATYFRQQKEIRGGGRLELMSSEFLDKDAGHHETEYAFCSECEIKFSIWEQERERFFSECPRFEKEPEEQIAIEITGYNAEYIKLACLTDLYRCSVFEGVAYKKVSLGEYHTNKIKQMLLNEDAGDKTDYPVVLRRFNKKYKLVDEISEIPTPSKGLYGVRYYEAIAPRGWYWIVKVDSRRCSEIEDCSLGATPDIKVINFGDFRNSKEFWPIVKMILKHKDNQ